MKLLFDQNLSYRLVRLLDDIYPDCQHVRNVGLKEAPDTQVWNFARSNGYSIKAVEQSLRIHFEDVERFEVDATATFLILS